LLKVYNSNNIEKCFDSIENDEPMFTASLQDDPSWTLAKKLEFDVKDKYVAVSSKEKLVIYSTENKSMGELVINFTIDLEKYEAIYDFKLNSGFDKKDFYKRLYNGIYPTSV
jgi:hypothetical protein